MLREDLRAHLAAGVTMIRSPGLAGDPPAWFGLAPDLPRAVHAGSRCIPARGRGSGGDRGRRGFSGARDGPGGATVHPALVVAAAEAGVKILAGTDSRPHGRVADEIRALASAGLRPVDAIAAGSWAARSYLGLGGLSPGAPADAVVYDADPRADLTQLDAPRAVVLRGRLVYRRSLSRTDFAAPASPAIPLVRCRRPWRWFPAVCPPPRRRSGCVS